MRANGSEKEFLGLGKSNSVWLSGSEGVQLLFNATFAGETRLNQYILLSGECFWLDVLMGTQPVQFSLVDSP